MLFLFFVINSAGNVGIGTTSPRGRLEVSDGTSNTAGEAINEAYIVGASTGSSEGILTIQSNDAMISDKGGSIAFGGRAVTGSSAGANWAFINGYKENGVSSNYGGYLSFATRPNAGAISERARIDSSGRLLVGTSTSTDYYGATAKSYITDQGGANLPLALETFRNDSAGAYLVLSHSRSGTAGNYTILQSGDGLGLISFNGSDGTDLGSIGATIKAEVDGTPGANDMPGRLVFSTTADGASSPTERLRINSAGFVGIGTNAPQARLHVNTGTDENLWVGSLGGSGAGVYLASVNNSGSANTPMQIGSASVINFAINGTEAARIDTSRRLLVGTSSGRAVGFTSLQAPVQVETTTAAAYTAVNNTNDANGCYVSIAKTRGTSAGAVTAVQNNDELGAIRISGSDGTGFVVGAQIIAAVDGTPGTNDLPTRLVFSTTADGASSPTERMRINAGGNFLINQTTTDDPAGTNTQGLAFGSAGWISNCRDGATPVLIGRKGADGTLVEFFQDGTVEGSISVSGTTVSYNGAHLSRWSQLPNGAEREEILRGTVLSNIDEMCEWGEEENEQLNRMKVSDVEGDKNVSGVFQAWDDDDDTYINDFYCAMTGDFIIRIAEGITVERGDLLMSAGDGTAKPQDDDIIRSKTIAKVASTNVSCTYDDGSYCVPCVLMAC
jgi:hypothetical protein